MEIKDQLKIRMDELGINPPELGRRVGVSAQSVRFWLAGRSFPGKAKTTLLENALSFKLNFSEGLNEYSTTVEDGLHQSDIDTFLAITKLPPELKHLFSKLAQEIVQCTEMPRTSPVYLQPGSTVNTRGYVTRPRTTGQS
ncbi:MAG: helix-turn-helix transcriptional regulator [Candidatus Saccharibacteria bacterium]|nr:helix-turn-helix transcriptional regulator [Rhodoferax sp.]